MHQLFASSIESSFGIFLSRGKFQPANSDVVGANLQMYHSRKRALNSLRLARSLTNDGMRLELGVGENFYSCDKFSTPFFPLFNELGFGFFLETG